MVDLALRIKAKDWVYILIVGVVLGLLLSLMGYRMLHLPLQDGALFGSILGFTITFYSLIFISWMNRSLLPKISRSYWQAIAVLFSFLSGFLGAQTAILTAEHSSVVIPALFQEASVEMSAMIGITTYVVGALLYRLVLMRNQKETADRLFIQSRLKSLETQLNPHFLFNALNSVAELVHSDPEKAEHAILKLSSFLRSTMQEDAMVPLHKELENVAAYVELENIRFSGAVNLALPPVHYSNLQVPKFSVQLLVENAIKHGLSHSHRTLQIEIGVDEEVRTITVINDGEPMQSNRFGIGLKNLDERLAYLCGGKLEVLASDPVTFKIQLGAPHEHPDR